MTRKIWIGILLGLMILLFLAVKFNKVTNTDLNDGSDKSNLIELIRVVDGDTIEIKIDGKNESVRLIGIDAPEMDEKNKEKAIKSKKYLENLLLNRKIRLEVDLSQDDRDVYNRLLRYIFLDDGTFVNKKMIEANMASEYTFIVPYKYQKEFREAEF